MARWVPTFAGTTLLLLVAVQASHGQAQGSADFYQGKTLRIVISTGVAGGFGEYARLLSEHIGKHIPGRPHVIVQSMPGAGGLLAANFLYASAPQDGTTIGIINSTVPFAPLWGSKGARFDTLKFNWLGTLDRAEGVCTLWHTSPVKTWADMLVKEFTVGSIGAGSEMELYPAMLNKLFATRIKVIAGYKAGSDVDLAMERGELDGRCAPISPRSRRCIPAGSPNARSACRSSLPSAGGPTYPTPPR
jgi:tripartite-type tricarboxylate transporter receptor subunit TctC